MTRLVVLVGAAVVLAVLLRRRREPPHRFTNVPTKDVTATFTNASGTYEIRGRMASSFWRDLERVDAV